MKNTIYWFSGTGNSLYAAKKLAERMGDSELVPMAGGVSDANVAAEAVGGEGWRIGFVFPSYYGDLPRIVRAFAERVPILPGTDLFAVVTIGAFGQGSIKALEALFAARGLVLRYGVGVRMNGNYLLNYDPALFGAKSERRVQAKLSKADAQLRRIVEDIKGGKQRIKKNALTAKTLYEDVASLDAGFSATGKCTGCGLCERICPVGNIELAGGRPTWQHRCEHCVACISWCPAAAIEYGQVTQKRTRYRNPHVGATELSSQSAHSKEAAHHEIQN